jgi:GAF domain-containing protein
VTENTDLDIGDVNAAPEYLACAITTRSEAIALIRHEGQIVGQIDVDSDTAGPFGAEAMAALRRCADILAPLVAQLAPR